MDVGTGKQLPCIVQLHVPENEDAGRRNKVISGNIPANDGTEMGKSSHRKHAGK